MDMKRLEQLRRGYERDELALDGLIELLEGYEDLWEGSKLEKEQLVALLGSQTEGKVEYHKGMLEAREAAKTYFNAWLYRVTVSDGVGVALGYEKTELELHPWLGK